jgi:hypothetical protein
MRDDRRASHDPARGGVVGGGALVARRPAYKPSNAGSDNSAPIVTGERPNSNLCSAEVMNASLFFNFIFIQSELIGLNFHCLNLEHL